MDTQDVTLQSIASLVFIAAGNFLTKNIWAFVGLVVLAIAIIVLKGYLAKKGIAAKGN